jgi:hypothetical protein
MSMALIDRAITGAKVRLEAAEKDLQNSRGNPTTLIRKQNVVDLRRITLDSLIHEKNHGRTLEYLEQLIDRIESGQAIDTYDLASAIDILEGRR